MPPKAGFEVLAQRMTVSFLSLMPSVLENRRNNPFIRIEKTKAIKKNAM